MTKKKQVERKFKLFRPESSADIEDIVAILLERETSILVNLSEYKMSKKEITKIMDFVLSYQKSYMLIKVKKIFPRVFVCWSEHPELYF